MLADHRTSMDFIEQWNRHLDFLKASAIAYDAGTHAEALRIAVSLRVMFHNTNRSTSLLAHLAKKNKVRVLDTFGEDTPLVPGGKTVIFTRLKVTMGGPAQLLIEAPLGMSPEYHRWLRFPVWWDQVVEVHDKTNLIRSSVVLSAANQDGGAHVDSRPSQLTKAMKKGFWTAGTFIPGQGIVSSRELSNYHFPLLRQFAYEVINSPELSLIQ
jgi:hypothetical protein